MFDDCYRMNYMNNYIANFKSHYKFNGELWMLAFNAIPLAISKQSIFDGGRSSLGYKFYHHYL
jgi:hypothetical protein